MGFDDAPMLVFWETTQACSLACRHCRARAVASPAPGELTPQEGTRLISDLGRFGPRPPVLVLTGGDVMARPDLLDLVGAARQAGLPVALAPSVTPRLSYEALVELRGLGVNSVSISLDGATASTHEQIRGTPGHFSRTLSAMRQVGELGFKLQVNTAIMRANVGELARIAVIVKEVQAASWELFFLIKVGRGLDQEELSAEENEDVAHLLFEASRYGFAVRAVEGPWCRRVAAWRNERLLTSGPVPAGNDGPATWFELGPLYQQQSHQLLDLMGPPQGPPSSSTAGTRDGKGIFFIAHDGWAFPAGFLPLPLGNVRGTSPVAIYRDHPLLRAIRRADFAGRCGRCEFRDLCGGSRARAWAASGDPLGEDPACAYVPS